MKYSYSDALITLVAAVTEACSVYRNKNSKPLAGIATKDPGIFRLNTNILHSNSRVGINFDNISAGKYFVLINRTQRHSFVSKVLRVRDKFPADSDVTK